MFCHLFACLLCFVTATDFGAVGWTTGGNAARLQRSRFIRPEDHRSGLSRALGNWFVTNFGRSKELSITSWTQMGTRSDLSEPGGKALLQNRLMDQLFNK